VVFGGYSQGAVMAVTLALQQRPFPSLGFICVGPATPNLQPLLPLMEPAAARGLRGWILAGELEPGLEQIVRLQHELTLRGVACHLEVVPQLGHEFPEDFATRLPSAIDFVLRTS
jgi:predicted esterase